MEVYGIFIDILFKDKKLGRVIDHAVEDIGNDAGVLANLRGEVLKCLLIRIRLISIGGYHRGNNNHVLHDSDSNVK